MPLNVLPLCYFIDIRKEVNEMEEVTTMQTTVCRECGDALTVWETQGLCILCED